MSLEALAAENWTVETVTILLGACGTVFNDLVVKMGTVGVTNKRTVDRMAQKLNTMATQYVYDIICCRRIKEREIFKRSNFKPP